MMDWFLAGGTGMFMILAIGVGSIAYAAQAVREPTSPRLAALRSLPALILSSALFATGTGLWMVNHGLSSDTLAKGQGMTRADLTTIGLIGFTEAAQAVTLGALLAMIVLGLRAVADARYAGRAAARAD